LKKYETGMLRNVVIVGHQSSGKTSLCEAILFNSGVTNRIGKVEDGNTTLDSSPEEVDRKISISAGLACLEYQKCKLNILDTPGYDDFCGEVLSCLPVVESGIVVMTADGGVEVGTEKTWKYLDRFGLPRIVCMNRMDKEHADFDKSLAEAQESLSGKIMPLMLPLGQGESFKGVVDILKRKAFVYKDDSGRFSEEDVPSELSGKVDEWRQKLMDFAAEADDSLLEKFLESGELSDEELNKGLAKGCASGTLVPLTVSSAAGNIGVKELMDIIVSMLPSPEWRKDIEAVEPSTGKGVKVVMDASAPTAAFVFKTLSDKHLGDISLIKAYSGSITAGQELYNSLEDSTERVNQLCFIQGKNKVETDSIEAGDIGAVIKLKSATVNSTLSDRSRPVKFNDIEFPEPTLRTAIVAKSKADVDKIGSGLHKLNEEDPTFTLKMDNELRQTILSGQGMLHLEVILSRLKRKYHVEVDMVQPKVAYRETITSSSQAQGKYKKQSGGRGQYGDVWLRLEPLPRGGGFEFVDAVVGGVVPSKFIPAVEKGVVAAMDGGVIAGYKVMDVKVTIYDGSHHSVDSSENAFKVAGSLGFKSAVKQAKPVILEPIMNVEVSVPEEFMGDVMGDLSMRRGKILGTEQEGKIQKISAQVPEAELYRYSTSLRSMTQGRATHIRSHSHYEVVPHDIVQKLIAEAEAEKEDQS